MMEYSKRPYKDWVYTMALMASSKKPIAALEVQQILGCKYYKSTWTMMHKIRVSMGHRVDWYAFTDYLKAGTSKVPVRALYMDPAEKIPSEEKYRLAVCKMHATAESYLLPEEHPFAASGKGRFRLIQFTANPSDIERFHHPVPRKSGLNFKARPWDEHLPFEQMDVAGMEYKRNGWFEEDPEKKWLGFYHIMAVNLRRNLDGIHHFVSDRYLLNYLNEFAYFTNRRYLGCNKLDTLLKLAVCKPWHIPHFVWSSTQS